MNLYWDYAEIVEESCHTEVICDLIKYDTKRIINYDDVLEMIPVEIIADYLEDRRK